MLTDDPDTLIVLNHPLWDLPGIGSELHVRQLELFLRQYIRWIHAFELNGYRSTQENAGVEALAESYGLPLVSGGDRHGCSPNGLLNLTNARSFGDFAREVRGGQSTIVVMPQYRQDLLTRKLSVAADAMRTYPRHPAGERHWSDRVLYERDGEVQTLAGAWDGDDPLWVRLIVRTFLLGASQPVLPALRLVVMLAGVSMSHRAGPATVLAANGVKPLPTLQPAPVPEDHSVRARVSDRGR
jgi:hypothetical protein